MTRDDAVAQDGAQNSVSSGARLGPLEPKWECMRAARQSPCTHPWLTCSPYPSPCLTRLPGRAAGGGKAPRWARGGFYSFFAAKRSSRAASK